MKIDKEKFNKLKQLDRIEFRQKLNEIKERYEFNFSIGFILTMIIISILCVLLSMNAYHMGGEETALSLIKVSILIFNVTLVYFLLEVILFIVVSIFEVKKKKELAEEYFVIEVKK